MRGMRALRLVLAVVIAVFALRAVPAYSALAIDPLTPTTLYAGTSGGVFKSTDGGASWSASGLINVAALAIDPLTPTTLYAGTSNVGVFGGVFKSADGGVSWNSTGGLTGIVSSLAIDPLTPTTLYAGTLGLDSLPGSWGGVYKSTDGGVSWSPAVLLGSGGLYCWPCGGVLALAIDPLIPTTLFAVTAADVAYYEDGSVNYSAPSQVIKSTDGGVNWIALLDVDSVLAINPLTPTTLYAGTDDAVYKSTDGGVSWNATGLTGVGVETLAIDPLTPTTLYAGTGTSGVYKSTDGGASWNAAGLSGVGDVQALAIDPLTPTTLYARTVTSGVYKSTNSGVSWNPTGLITWSQISAVSLNPTSVVGGSPSTGTVTLSAEAPAAGAVVELATGDTNIATVPARVTVAAGTTSADFMVSTRPVNASLEFYRVLIWAASGGGTSSAVLTVTPTVNPTTLSALSLNPTSVTGGAASIGTVTLNTAAPASGVIVALSNSNPTVATVPASVTVPAGATSAAFTISTSPVAASIAVTISATYSGVRKSANLIINPAITLLSLSLNPTSVTAGSTSSETVTLSASASAGGAMVALASSNTAVATVPTSVTVAAGATSATFTVSTNSLTGCASSGVTISATYGGVTRSAGLTVTPATDTVTIQQADYFANRHQLRVAATSTGSTAALQVYVTSTGELIGTLKRYDGNRYSGQFTWPLNPQNITVRSSLCGSATKAVTSK
jgi:photosystem II stability/assembly factor-like uncharacterized protein